MTKPTLEGNISMLNAKKEYDRDKTERLTKSHWLSDYALDIYKTMKEAEVRRLPLNFMSTQEDERPKLLQLCQFITRTYKLSRSTMHLAIYYLDRFIDFYTIRSEKLELVALTCLHVAGQIENMDSCVPRYSEMNRVTNHTYTSFEFKAVERKVLTFFNFELMRPTTASFVELLACRFLTQEDYEDYSRKLDECPALEATYPRFNCLEKMLATLAQVLLRLADYTLNMYKYSNDLPSVLAAGCIAAVRQVSGVPDVWTPYLAELTSCTAEMVEPYVDVLTLYHYYQTTADVEQLNKTEDTWHNPDSGFDEEFFQVPQVEVLAVEVETYNIITVQLKKNNAQAPTLKRNRVLLCEEPELKRKKMNSDA